MIAYLWFCWNLELDLSDLTNAANVWVRFSQQAKSVFSTKFKKLDLNNCARQYTKLLQTFGSVAQSIDINVDFCSTEINVLATIARYCSSMLKELTLRRCQFNDQFFNDLSFNLMLSKLEKLSFIGCRMFGGLNDLPSVCDELKVLHIDDCLFRTDVPIWSKFKKLEELRMIHNADCNIYWIVLSLRAQQ